MARPRQKRKQRSSRPVVRQRQKSKRLNIKANPIVAANWDKSLTLTQNYRRLGLAARLNASTGGTEPNMGVQKHDASEDATMKAAQDDPLAIKNSKGTGRALDDVTVVRDENGKIVEVIDDAQEKSNGNPLNDHLNGLSDSDSEDEPAQSATWGIVPNLERASQYTSKRKPKRQSQTEREWLQRLSNRWKDDFDGMSRDAKLNPMQHSAGELRKRMRLWQASRQSVEVNE